MYVQYVHSMYVLVHALLHASLSMAHLKDRRGIDNLEDVTVKRFWYNDSEKMLAYCIVAE